MPTAKPGRPIVFGEVLFDHFPDGNMVLGGAPFNVAWHLEAFGQAPVLISRVGNDALGRRVGEAMRNRGMDCRGLQLDSAHATGTVEVSFSDGEPTYAIVRDRAYDFVEAEDLPSVDHPALLYHGSLALRGDVSRRAFQELRSRVSAPRFMDVNLRPPWWNPQQVRSLMAGASWVKLNEEELYQLETTDGDRRQRANNLCREYGLQGLIVTQGDRGAEMYSGITSFAVSPEPVDAIVDTVGAGDAYASVVILGLLKEWSLQTTLDRAQSFAGAIIGVRGATVSDPAFYDRFIRAWNPNA